MLLTVYEWIIQRLHTHTHTHTHTHISQRIIYSLWDLAPLHVVREDVKLGNLWSLPVVTFQDYVSKEWEIG